MTIEIWRDIRGYEGLYQISNFGKVQSLDRLRNNNKKYKGKILNLILTMYGYFKVSLYKNDQIKQISVHRLVALHFVKRINKDQITVNHLDGNKTNNHFSNLEWVTQKENNKHARVTRLNKSFGESVNTCKLTEKQVLQIRKLLNSGRYKQWQIANYFGVSQVTISMINTGRTWKQL